MELGIQYDVRTISSGHVGGSSREPTFDSRLNVKMVRSLMREFMAEAAPEVWGAENAYLSTAGRLGPTWIHGTALGDVIYARNDGCACSDRGVGGERLRTGDHSLGKVYPTTLGIGVDVQSIEEVSESLTRFSNRYLHRLFSAREMNEGLGADPCVLAGKFSTKEALAKALNVGGESFPWSSVEVRAESSDILEVHFSGPARDLVHRRAATHVAGAIVYGAREVCAIAAVEFNPRLNCHKWK
jgi:holo-[acyl-carrier protein] synthase